MIKRVISTTPINFIVSDNQTFNHLTSVILQACSLVFKICLKCLHIFLKKCMKPVFYNNSELPQPIAGR